MAGLGSIPADEPQTLAAPKKASAMHEASVALTAKRNAVACLKLRAVDERLAANVVGGQASARMAVYASSATNINTLLKRHRTNARENLV
jgi:hypothetical protein